MTGLRFGTDGIRGVANTELTAEVALAVARASARVLRIDRIVVGRDTRRSGPMLEAALIAGFTSAGVDVLRLGVAPSPAVAFVAEQEGTAGAVISASHNPFMDNGIKLFGAGGRKLHDGVEDDIEAALHEPLAEPASGGALGTVLDHRAGLSAYVEHVSAVGRLDGLRVALDCANGSASPFAAEVFTRAGASVSVVAAEPDGCNINDHCGATHPERLAELVAAQDVDLGLAFDGDA